MNELVKKDKIEDGVKDHSEKEGKKKYTQHYVVTDDIFLYRLKWKSRTIKANP